MSRCVFLSHLLQVATLASEGALKESIEQEALIREVFVCGDQTSEAQNEIEKMMLEDENEAKVAEKGPVKVPGWGSWTGEGVRATGRKERRASKLQDVDKPKSRVYVNRKLDRKVRSLVMVEKSWFQHALYPKC